MHRIAILLAFIHAHIESDQQLINYLDDKDNPQVSEVAFCVIQSQTAVYKAMISMCYEVHHLDKKWLLEEMNLCRQGIEFTTAGRTKQQSMGPSAQIANRWNGFMSRSI